MRRGDPGQQKRRPGEGEALSCIGMQEFNESTAVFFLHVFDMKCCFLFEQKGKHVLVVKL